SKGELSRVALAPPLTACPCYSGNAGASITGETIMAEEAPSIQVSSATRGMPHADALRNAQSAITEIGLQVTFESGPHIGGAGTLNGAGVAVLVTCLTVGQRTFIEFVGASLDPDAAEQARNRVRTITVGPAS